MSDTQQRPNILFFLPDQHRADFVGWNAALPVRTPNLSALARRGVVFTHALCPSPLCAPSRASLAAGKDYPRCRVANNQKDYPLDQPTFYGMLRDSGYHVTGVGKFDLQKASANHSLDGTALIHAWGFSAGVDSKGKWDAVNSWDGEPHDAYMAYLDRHGLATTHVADLERRRGRAYAETDPTPLPEHAYGDNWVADQGLRMLNEAPPDQPWFLQVNFPGPHDPMDVTEQMHAAWHCVDFPPPHGNDQFDPTIHTRIRRNYAAMVENIDRHLGRYLDALEARGELENTFIVYASDHGEMLGDHNRWAKSTYYQPSVSIPLVIAGPGVVAGQAFQGPVTLHDLAATFLDVAGLEIPAAMDSQSLQPVLRDISAPHRSYVISGLVTAKQRWHLIFDGRYKLIKVAGKSPHLFDLQEDPWEDHDLASSTPQVAAQLEAPLEQELLHPV